METIVKIAEINRRKSENITRAVEDIFYTLFSDDRLETCEAQEECASVNSVEVNLKASSRELDSIFSWVSNLASRIGAKVPDDEFGVFSIPQEVGKTLR